MVKTLEDVEDQSQLLETPNLVIIPHSSENLKSQCIVLSQSY
jgi:hypothetical protein